MFLARFTQAGVELVDRTGRPHEPLPLEKASNGTASSPRKSVQVLSWALLRDGASGAALDQSSANAAIADSYLSFGRRVSEQLHGNYVYALWDQWERLALLSRDFPGTRPLYYRVAGPCLTVSSSLRAILDCTNQTLEVDPAWLAARLWSEPSHPSRSPFRQVRQVPPGATMAWQPGDGEPRIVHGRVLDYTTTWRASRPLHQLTAYQHALVNAVGTVTRTPHRIAVEFSAGLDSASALAVASHVRGTAAEPLQPLGFMTDTEQRWAIDQVLEHVPGVRPFVTCQRTALTRTHATQVLGYPSVTNIASGHAALYSLAQHAGAEVLLSGFGGDQCATSDASAAVSEAVAHFRPDLAFNMTWDRRLRTLARGGLTRFRRWRPRRQLEPPATLRPAVLTPDAQKIAESWLSEAAGGACQNPPLTVNAHCRDELEDPWLSTRASECAVVAHSFGIEHHAPFLDFHLLQTYLQAATTWKRANGYGRFLHRTSMSQLLPLSIAWHPSKTYGQPLPPTRGAARQLPDFADLNADVRVLIDPDQWTEARSNSLRGDRTNVWILNQAAILSTWMNER